jgi:putative ABC transport system permease protein
MGVARIHGRNLEDLRSDTTYRVPGWLQEIRATYRDTVFTTERVTAGFLRPRSIDSDTLWVSVEADIAKGLKLGLGDTVVFDVQGIPTTAVVGSIREVNWGRLSPNFLFIFSPGALDEAPQFHVFLARTPDKARSAEFQRKLVKQLPSVSVIDMTLVLRTVETLFRQIREVTDYLALLAVLLGFAILLSSVSTSRFHRIQESVLFRTLGASRGHIQRITAMEYGIVATLGGLSGLLLASIGSQLLLHFMFEIRPVPDWTTLVCVLVGTVTVTVTLGLLLNRRVLKVSPLQIWRTET